MPADSADEAQDFTERLITDAIARRKTLTLPFSGFCLACGTEVGERRYCDSYCRVDHENSLKRRAAGY